VAKGEVLVAKRGDSGKIIMGFKAGGRPDWPAMTDGLRTFRQVLRRVATRFGRSDGSEMTDSCPSLIFGSVGTHLAGWGLVGTP